MAALDKRRERLLTQQKKQLEALGKQVEQGPATKSASSRSTRSKQADFVGPELSSVR